LVDAEFDPGRIHCGTSHSDKSGVRDPFAQGQNKLGRMPLTRQITCRE
jgi:hypothetical protein